MLYKGVCVWLSPDSGFVSIGDVQERETKDLEERKS